MSRANSHTITCACGEEYTGQIYEYVNVEQEPQLRYTVLAGLLNVLTCPMCGRKAAFAKPFVYSDQTNNLLVYVHPRADMPEEARMEILRRLRSVYIKAMESEEKQTHTRLVPGSEGQAMTITPASTEETPSLQVVFGLDQLHNLINAALPHEERLGKLALSTQSRDEAERGQFLAIARKLATEMECSFEVDDLPDEYTVWLYGPRRQISAIIRELAPRG